jgi:predicted RNA-binding Zn-ribbon protein involved in translation (DUF1610 family)
MSLVITNEMCPVHADCSNEFYLEFANCETCGIQINVDQEFNAGEQIKFNCHNCGDGNTLQM